MKHVTWVLPACLVVFGVGCGEGNDHPPADWRLGGIWTGSERVELPENQSASRAVSLMVTVSDRTVGVDWICPGKTGRVEMEATTESEAQWRGVIVCEPMAGLPGCETVQVEFNEVRLMLIAQDELRIDATGVAHGCSQHRTARFGVLAERVQQAVTERLSR